MEENNTQVTSITKKELIAFSDFLDIEKKIQINVGRILEIERIEKSNKLVKLTVDFGTEIRTVVTNVFADVLEDLERVKMYTKGSSFLFVTNLKPVVMMGIESTAMILPGQPELGCLVEVRRTTTTLTGDPNLRPTGIQIL